MEKTTVVVLAFIIFMMMFAWINVAVYWVVTNGT